ncbi:heavy-metal-associated domain-containing protein [Naumannella halotolerans]|uniref:Copper chaperone CopZ n=1 Tax=Naumannella halotolerans TaxID=993414 RepID=A0A4R7J890_9ACTN|nr:heavy-metal-associated domain-containing protein [Naumannella halotolerans]TDT32996.1 copper chaperone CopZ [Naumannella halotolerans]
MAANEYQVTGMTCGHCEMSVREEVSEVPGVEEIQVSAQTGKLVVSGSGDIDEAKVLAAVEEAGYTAVRARRHHHQRGSRSPSTPTATGAERAPLTARA